MDFTFFDQPVLIEIIEYPSYKKEQRKAKQKVFKNPGIMQGVKIFDAQARN